MSSPTASLAGRRVLITGAARGIGAALAHRRTERGARVALAGLEEDLLAETAARLDAPWWTCDVTDRPRVDQVVDEAADALGGIDVVDRVAEGPEASGWTDRERTLLRAVDELHLRRDLADATWAEVREHLDERSAMELVLLVAHYEMLATTITTLRIPLDQPRRPFG